MDKWDGDDGVAADDIATASVHIKQQGNPLVIWSLPLVALLVAIYLVYKSITEAGVEFTVHFDRGVGLKPNETKLKYEDIDIGVVKSISMSNDLQGMDALIEIERDVSMLLQKDTVFWMVKPEVTISRVTGLEALVSGKYITLELGEETSVLGKGKILKLKPSRFRYQALAEAPRKPPYLGGLHLTITAAEAGSVAKGAPVLFHQVTVGNVEKVRLAENGGIEFDVYIEEKYKQLVKNNVRFWNVSGISIEGSLADLDVRVNSLTSLLVGGLAFDVPDGVSARGQAQNFDRYSLYEDRAAAMQKKRKKGLHITLIADELNSIKPGVKVFYRKVAVGEVQSVELAGNAQHVRISLLIDYRYAPLVRHNSHFWNASGVGIDVGLFSGAQIRTESLESLLEGGIAFATPDASVKVVGINQTKPLVELSDKSSDSVTSDARSKVSRIGPKKGLKKSTNKRAEQPVSQTTSGEAKSVAKKSELVKLADSAKSGHEFHLHREHKEKWLQWRPEIQLNP